MRLFRFFLIFSVIFIMVTACGVSDDDETDTEGSNQENNSGDNTGDNNSDENQQNTNCGNGLTDTGEVCDGNAIDCQSIDTGYTGGIATCKPDCSGWNTSDCKGNGSSSEDPTNPGNNEDPTNPGGNGNGGFDKNSQGIWVDPKTYLIWENPMGHKGTGGLGPNHAKSVEYCENLVLAGADDWRLPTIDELRTIVRGVSTTMTGGTCPTSESCSDQDTCNKNKNNSQPYGYSCFGCYALDDQYKDGESFLTEDDCQLSDVQLGNDECYIVPAMFGDPCNGTWSNTPNTSTAGKLANAFWYLNYKAGYIGSDSDTLSGANWVRCVRQGTADDVPEQDAEAEQNPDWECKVEADCPEGKWCQNHKCVIKPAETYLASNGLEWQAGEVEKAASWDAAKTYCDSLELAGKSDWRLPNIDELKSLSTCDKTAACGVTTECLSFTSCGGQQCKSNTCASGHYLPDEVAQQTDSCWTISEESVSTNNAWLVNFSNGSVFYQAKTASYYYARCVRGSMN